MKKYIYPENKTIYTDKYTTKQFNRVLNPYLFCHKSFLQSSYYIRSYFEYLDTIDKGGKVYFVTLTYNDAHLPYYEGVKCFSHSDLRNLTAGAFKKFVNRGLDCTLKYLITCELGHLHGRPHYHCLFYLTPNSKDSILPDDAGILSLVKKYWIDKNKKSIGFISAGKFGCVVSSARALNYVSKYVGKDIVVEDKAFKVYQNVYNRSFDNLKDDFENKIAFINQQDLDKSYVDENVSLFDDSFGKMFDTLETNIKYLTFTREKSDVIASNSAREFRNSYGNKVRCSQNFGVCLVTAGSKYYVNPLDPKVTIPSEKGFEVKNIPLYCYRKLYFDLVPDKVDSSKKIAVRNELGKKFALKSIKSQLNNYSDISALLQSNFKLSCHEANLLGQSYNIYNLIYRGSRFDCSDVAPINPLSDYIRFLEHPYFRLNDNELFTLSSKLTVDSQDYINHPDFSYLKKFGLDRIDDLMSRYYVNMDKKSKKDFYDTKNVKTFFNYINNIF